jgi:hypothetical protein
LLVETFAFAPTIFNVEPSYVKLVELWTTLPVESYTGIIFAVADWTVAVDEPISASIVITLSFKDNVTFEPASNL